MTNLRKCSKNKMIFGVCCGLANTLGLDISIVRLLTVVGAIFTGSILFWIYLLLAIVLPSDEA